MSFKDQITQDLDNVFFNTDEFAVSATFRSESIIVDFKEKDDVIFDSDLGSDVSSSVPTALCKSADVADAEHGDELVIFGVAYYIIDMDPAVDQTRKLYLSKDRP